MHKSILFLMLLTSILSAETWQFEAAAVNDLGRMTREALFSQWLPLALPEGQSPAIPGEFVMYQHEGLTYYFGPFLNQAEAAKAEATLLALQKKLIALDAKFQSSRVEIVESSQQPGEPGGENIPPKKTEKEPRPSETAPYPRADSGEAPQTSPNGQTEMGIPENGSTSADDEATSAESNPGGASEEPPQGENSEKMDPAGTEKSSESSDASETPPQAESEDTSEPNDAPAPPETAETPPPEEISAETPEEIPTPLPEPTPTPTPEPAPTATPTPTATPAAMATPIPAILPAPQTTPQPTAMPAAEMTQNPSSLKETSPQMFWLGSFLVIGLLAGIYQVIKKQ